ncbi:WASH complex subunit 4 [Lamellibrachia satsuma]|nr:WASH complex subunit 4 [Lamellibrachia satsuma]
MGTDAQNWSFDEFDEDSLKIAGKVQLKKYGQFLNEYASQLKEIEGALGESIGDAWDSTLDPVSLEFTPYEQTTLLQLVRTDNKVLNKVVAVLATLCAECDFLKYEAENKFYTSLLFYGEGVGEDLEEGEAQIMMGRMVPLLQELSCFVTRCYEVVKHILQQLSSLYTSGRSIPKVMNVSDVHFQMIYEHLGQVLGVLITLDEIVESQNLMREHWTLYKRMLTSVKHDPQRFSLPREKIRPFEHFLSNLDSQVLAGDIFQECIQQMFDDNAVNVSKNSLFADEFMFNIRSYLSLLQQRVGETNEQDQRLKWVDVCGLYLLHYHIYRVADKKIFKSLWDVHKKLPAVNLTGSVTWFPNEFLMQKLPNMAKALDKKAMVAVVTSRQTWLQNRNHVLMRETQVIYQQVAAWMVKMESNLMNNATLPDELNGRCLTLCSGFAVRIQHQPPGEDHHEPTRGTREADDKDGRPCPVSPH